MMSFSTAGLRIGYLGAVSVIMIGHERGGLSQQGCGRGCALGNCVPEADR
jgi:hypothetical protein